MPSASKDQYTHGHHESVLRSHSWRTVENSAAYVIPLLAPGVSVLDIGCGPGTITIDFAKRVAPGEVIGIDSASEVIATARQAKTDSGQTNVAFNTGDGYELGYGDSSFDIVHAHQVLQHLSDPVSFLFEMGRVAKPAGVVAVRDADYGAMSWAPADPRLDRWMAVYQAVARHNNAEPDAARHLVRWATEAGFSEITPSADTWVFATPADRLWWGTLWAERVTASSFAEQAIEYGISDSKELFNLAEGWREWAQHPTSWFAVMSGELLCRNLAA